MVTVIDSSLEGWNESLEIVSEFYRKNDIYGKFAVIDFTSKKNDRKEVPYIEGIYEFNKDSVDLWGHVRGNEFEAFIKKEFDAMMVLGNKPSPALTYLISRSKAHFKVGRSNAGYSFDMFIDPPSELGFSQAEGARAMIGFLFSIRWK